MSYPRHIVFVTAIIRNNRGDILLIKSPLRDWEPPGGQVEHGEDIIEAAIRETREETGYEVAINRIVNIYQNTGNENSEPKIGFTVEGSLLNGHARTSNESLEVGWFTPQETTVLVTYPPTADRINDYLNYEGRCCFRAYTNKPYRVTRLL